MTPWPGGPVTSCAAPTPRSSFCCGVRWPTPGACQAGWGRCAGPAGRRAPPGPASVPAKRTRPAGALAWVRRFELLFVLYVSSSGFAVRTATTGVLVLGGSGVQHDHRLTGMKQGLRKVSTRSGRVHEWPDRTRGSSLVESPQVRGGVRSVSTGATTSHRRSVAQLSYDAHLKGLPVQPVMTQNGPLTDMDCAATRRIRGSRGRRCDGS
jgi:hypothetical protein